jgi:hypothetical protein
LDGKKWKSKLIPTIFFLSLSLFSQIFSQLSEKERSATHRVEVARGK